MDPVYVRRSGALGGEHNPLSVRGKRRVIVQAVRGQKRALVAVVRIGEEKADSRRTNARKQQACGLFGMRFIRRTGTGRTAAGARGGSLRGGRSTLADRERSSPG